MAIGEMDAGIGATFGLEIDGVVIKQITEVSGLAIEVDVIELKQNTADGKYVVKKLPGRPKSGEITLTRPWTADSNFEKWMKDITHGKVGAARKGGSVIVYDLEGMEIKRYIMAHGWPKKLEVSNMKAGATDVTTEKLIVTHEGISVG